MEKSKEVFKVGKDLLKIGCLLPFGGLFVGFILYVLYQSFLAAPLATVGKCRGNCLYTATNGIRTVYIVGYSADGSRLLTRGADLLIHDALTGDKIAEVDLKDEGYRLAISEDGTQIVAAKGDALEFFNWDGELVRYWTHREGSSMSDMAQVPMVNGFAVTDNAGISIWKNSDDSMLVRLYEEEGGSLLTSSLQNDRLATLNLDTDQVIVWDLQNLDDAYTINNVGAGTLATSNDIRLSADGSVLAVATQGAVRVYNAGNGDRLATLETEQDYATAFAFNLEKNLIAIGYTTGDVVVWDYVQDVLVTQFPHGNRPRTLAISPDGTQLAVGLSYNVEVSGGELIFGNRNSRSYNPIIRQSDNRVDRTPGYAIVWSLAGE
jgi:WD40 repeat protein